MATFECKVYKLRIEPHTNADTLELAIVGDYRSCVRKGEFQTGDLAVYIPEGSIVPDWLLGKLGLVGKLAGSDKNRVKAVKLRGQISQGLIYPVKTKVDFNHELVIGNGALDVMYVNEQQDVTQELGITKYEPPIPSHMNGEVNNAFGYTLHYDIENVKKYPEILQENEQVVVTEKLHGSWCCYGYHKDFGKIVTSKGLSARGVALKFNEVNKDNVYLKVLRDVLTIDDKDLIDRILETTTDPFYVLGEVFGPIQDLKYGFNKPQFRVFDIYVGSPGQGRYLNDSQKDLFCDTWQLQRVPVLYRGPYTRQIINELTDGNETVSGNGVHIREGVVITPCVERCDDQIGRVILKSVSENYLLRKGDVTEFN